jgi:hypothetical protein
MMPVLAAGGPDRRSTASLDAKLATPIVRDGDRTSFVAYDRQHAPPSQ